MISKIMIAGLIMSVACSITAMADEENETAVGPVEYETPVDPDESDEDLAHDDFNVSITVFNDADVVAKVYTFSGDDRSCKGEYEIDHILPDETETIECKSNNANSCRVSAEVADEFRGTCEPLEDGSLMICHSTEAGYYCSIE